MVGLDLPSFQSCHCPHFALMASRNSFCGLIPHAAQWASMSEMSCSMAGNMGELPHIGKGNFPMERSWGMGHFPHMQKKTLDAFVRGLQIVMEAEGIKMKPLSVAAGMGESGVRDLIRNESSPKVANAYALARELGRTVDEIIQIGMTGDLNARPAHAPIAVAGCVGAGARVDLLDAYEKGDGMYHVARPPQLKPHGIVAVEVKERA